MTQSNDQPGDGCLSCLSLLGMVFLMLTAGWSTLSYFSLQKSATNACPDAGVSHVSYRMDTRSVLIPLGTDHAKVTCLDGTTISLKAPR